MVKELASKLKATLEAVLERTEAPKGQVYTFEHHQAAPRALKNKARSALL